MHTSKQQTTDEIKAAMEAAMKAFTITQKKYKNAFKQLAN